MSASVLNKGGKRAWRGLVVAAVLLWAGVAAAKGPLYLWELSDARGELRAWLYGTIHVCDAACFPLPADVQKALAAADSLALELDPADPLLARRLGEAALLPAGQQLDALLPPALRPRLAAVAARLGLPGEVLQRLQPWMAGTLLTVRAAQQAGFGTEHGVDLWLARAARERGLALVELESVDRQIRALAAGGVAAQRASLAEIIALIEDDAAPAYFAGLLAAWRAGQAEQIDRLVREDAASPEMAPLLAELLDARNREMADAIATRLQPGRRAFIAVGAGHFGGAGGLLELLASRGFRLRQVEAEHD